MIITQGEGEIKISQRLRKIKCAEQTYAIISDDSDAIIQALTSQTIKIDVINIQIGQIFSVEKFLSLLLLQLPHLCPSRISVEFCAMVLMLGNDYLPKLRFQSFYTLWYRYVKMSKRNGSAFLVNIDSMSFNLQVLGELLDFVSPEEERFTKRVRVNNSSEDDDDLEKIDHISAHKPQKGMVSSYLCGVLCKYLLP